MLREACSAFFAPPAPSGAAPGAKGRRERELRGGKFSFGEGDFVFTFANPRLARINIDKKVERLNPDP